jgi:hypothetical protein
MDTDTGCTLSLTKGGASRTYRRDRRDWDEYERFWSLLLPFSRSQAEVHQALLAQCMLGYLITNIHITLFVLI